MPNDVVNKRASPLSPCNSLKIGRLSEPTRYRFYNSSDEFSKK